ncbi:MAG: cytochrome b [Burkholderiaceae bacterium]
MADETFPARSTAPQRYGGAAQLLHWATAVLVLAAFVYGPGGPEERVYAPSRDFDRHLHETLGSTVFVLAVVRVAWRLVARRPDPAPVNRWMGLAAAAVQGLLYVLLFAVPLTAITGAWLEGHPLAYLGGLQIAAPFAASHDAGAAVATIHGWLGDAILWVAGLHAVAALYHHFILRDGVLASMLPRWVLAAPRGTGREGVGRWR